MEGSGTIVTSNVASQMSGGISGVVVRHACMRNVKEWNPGSSRSDAGPARADRARWCAGGCESPASVALLMLGWVAPRRL